MLGTVLCMESIHVHVHVHVLFIFLLKQKLYDEMVARTNDIIKLGRVPDHLRKHHKGFREWELGANRSDHHTILQVQIIPSSYQHITNCQSYLSKAYNLQQHNPLSPKL